MTENTRTNYDAIFCGKQPLHNTNLIQDHGVLIVLENVSMQIVQVSENIDQLLHLPMEEVIGLGLKDILTADSFDTVKQSVVSGLVKVKVPQNIYFNINNVSTGYLATIHQKDELLLIEVEFANLLTNKATFINVFQQVKQVMSAIDAATTVNEVAAVAVTEIKRLSGFDKVMIYCFDEEWNGTVIAEAMEEEMESYLGLKFPASDIPKQARDLYLSNPYRVIPNRNYKPVQLSPFVNPYTNTWTDLSDCKLRSVAQVHLEYLANMKVVASMSTRIVHREKLWGLISCHHRTAKHLSFEETSVFELLSNVISGKISSVINKTSAERTTVLHQHFHQLKQQLYVFDDLLNMFIYNKELLLALLNADGVAICWNNRVETFGLTPENTEVIALQHWLQQKQLKETVHLPALSLAFDKAKAYSAMASGLLALPIEPEVGNYILAFRPEAVKQVKWGGNPNQAVNFEPNTTNYHPRNSFETWKETIKNTAVRWTDEEVAIAERLRITLVEYSLHRKNNELVDAIKEFKFVANLIPQHVWTTTPDGKPDFFNERWYSYTGLDEAQSLSHNWSTVLHPEDRERTLLTWEKSIKNKTDYNIECRLRNKDGAYSWFLIRGLPLLDSNQNVVKWFGTSTNIDDRKQMEQMLEQKVQDRTAALTLSNNELEIRNEELRQYAYIASHDLQEPVRKIQVFSTIIKEKLLRDDLPKAEEFLNRIINSSSRMKSLIIDLLAYSSLDDNIKWERVDLNVVIGEVLTDFELLIEEKKATFNIGPLPVIVSKAEQMRQVSQNLISNSLNYAAVERSPVIRISATRIATAELNAEEDQDGKYVKIEVADNGVGFDQKYADKIFQIFQRLQPKNEKSGTGIGLSIVKKIIDQHKGLISATGVENEGAVFTIILPISQ